MSLDNLNIQYTTEENDNINIFKCLHSWVVSDLLHYELFEGLTYDELLYIVNWLTEPHYVAQGLNLKITK